MRLHRCGDVKPSPPCSCPSFSTVVSEACSQASCECAVHAARHSVVSQEAFGIACAQACIMLDVAPRSCGIVLAAP
jgi:hypothetical protein